MDDLPIQIVVIAGVLITCFVGPVVAGFLLLHRKRRARARRRSSIVKELLRGPGHSLREQLDQATADVTWEIALLMVVPLMALTTFLAQGHVMGLSRMQRLAPVYVILALAFIAWTVRKLLTISVRLDNLKAGYDAELAVGQELDQLMRQGAVVFHDMPADGFNIDHVVIAREGIFAVETKGFTKPKQGGGKADATVVFDGKVLKFPTWFTREPLDQAVRQAAWLSKWLASATGCPISVLAVVALPGWFVELKGRVEVRVFNGKQLSGLLAARGTQPLSAEDVRRVVHQVEQRCRTVAPRYAEEVRAS
jgi:hypothetical protein